MNDRDARTGLADRVRRRRTALGLRQEQAAQRAGISESYLSRIEHGERVPGPDVLARLAAALDTSVEFLRTGVEREAIERLTLELRYAELALHSGEPQAAADAFAALLRTGSEHGVPEIREQARWGLGQAFEALGRLEDAVVAYEDLRGAADPRSLLWVDASVAACRCYREAGDLSRAVDVGEQALARMADLGIDNTEGGIRLAVTMLAAYYERGDVLRATQLAREAVEQAERGGTLQGRAAAYWNASQVLAERGSVRDALTYADRALALLAEGADERSLARLRVAYARLLTRHQGGDPQQALGLLDQARTALDGGTGSAVDVATCDVEEARALLALGAFDEADAALTRAVEGLGDTPRLELAAALTMRGHLHSVRGDSAAAETSFRQAAGVLAVFGASRRAATAWVELAEFQAAIGATDDALTAYRAAASCLGAAPAASPVLGAEITLDYSA